MATDFAPEVSAKRATIVPEPPKPGTVEKKHNLTDAYIEAVRDMAEGQTRILHDFGGNDSVPGLRARIGRHRITWVYRRDDRRHGKRKISFKRLGFYPSMDVNAAREAAKIAAGRVASGTSEPGRKIATKFKDAFADYLEYLQGKADEADKPARWKQNVQKLGDRYILPEWGGMSLYDMGRDEGRKAMKAWHRKLKKTKPTSANHCARIIRAIYLQACETDDSLSSEPKKLPTAACRMTGEKWQKDRGKDKPGLPWGDFPKWREACQKLSPIRAAYHLTNLLTGARPGELARTPWSNYNAEARMLTIGNSKTGGDIPIPASSAIADALSAARKASPNSDLIFPGCEQAGHRDPLPARGHALRRTYKTIATDRGVSAELTSFLLGHVPEGMTAKYALARMLAEGPKMREKQEAISQKIMELLRLR